MKKFVRDLVPACCAVLLMAGCGNHVSGSGGNSAGGVTLSPEEQEIFSEGLSGVMKYITSEDLLIQAIGESIAEYIQEFSSSGYQEAYDYGQNSYGYDPFRAAVTTGAGAASQINAFMEALFGEWESVMESFSQEEGAASIKVNFDETVDVGSMKAEEWKKAGLDVYKFIADLAEWTGDPETDFNETLRRIQKNLGFYTDGAFYEFIDDVLRIKRLYLSAKANVDYDWSEGKMYSKTVSTAGMDLNVAVAALDVNRILAKLYSRKTDLPVKALSLAVSGKVDARATSADITNLVEYISGPEDDEFSPSGSARADVEADINLQTTLCTATGLGGIVSAGISPRAGLKNLDDLLDLIPYFASYPEIDEPVVEEPSGDKGKDEYRMMMQAAAYGGDSDDERSNEALLKILDKLLTVSISVSNGTSVTFSRTYTPTKIYNLIMDALI